MSTTHEFIAMKTLERSSFKIRRSLRLASKRFLVRSSYPNDLLHAVKTIHRTSFRPGKWRLNQDDLGRRSYQAECLIKLKLEDQSLDPRVLEN